MIIHTHTPVDRGNHVWRLIINMPAGQKCKSDPSRSAVERFMETFPAVIAEDRWALEKQQRCSPIPTTAMSRCFCGPTGLCAGRARS